MQVGYKKTVLMLVMLNILLHRFYLDNNFEIGNPASVRNTLIEEEKERERERERDY